MRRRQVFIVQQGVWKSELESMPLAAGCLKACADLDPALSDHEVSILNFRGGDPVERVARRVLTPAPPDVLAFSVFGWNVPAFTAVVDAYKTIKRDGVVIFGGTHVAHQGESVFRRFPNVDVVVDGEGELVFPQLLRVASEGMEPAALAEVPGISFRDGDGSCVTTAEPARITDFSSVPSPFLGGAIPLVDERGSFRYDVALMETNRGCPYRCAFCYWGGAVGQRVRDFPRDRLLAELDLFGFHHVPTVVLCDANFGLRAADAEFVEAVIRTRERYGFPLSIETSWAKNKSRRFYEIVERMAAEGLRSSFTIALQSLNDAVLRDMDRSNMRLNDWQDLVAFLEGIGLDCYAELIWGAPGETRDSFFEAYDTLAAHVSRIATYPLLVLPNTTYWNDREERGLVTLRGEEDDFDYLIGSNTMSVDDNFGMQPFLFWARTVAENMMLTTTFAVARRHLGLTQSQLLRDLCAYIERRNDPTSRRIVECYRDRIISADIVAVGLRALYADTGVDDLFAAWWASVLQDHAPDEETARFLDCAFRLDWSTRPIYEPALAALPPVVDRPDGSYFVRQLDFDHAPAELLAGRRPPATDTVTYAFYYRTGFADHIDSHEVAAHYRGVLHERSRAERTRLTMTDTDDRLLRVKTGIRS